MQWLAWHPDWLLVYDNVENPDDLTPYIGALHQGAPPRHQPPHHWLARQRPHPDPGQPRPDDATALLCRLASRTPAPPHASRPTPELSPSSLGYLPLAIKQAGAYLAQNRDISFDAYRRRLDSKLAKTAHGIDAERTLARIWNVTLHALETTDPLGRGTYCTPPPGSPPTTSPTACSPRPVPTRTTSPKPSEPLPRTAWSPTPAPHSASTAWSRPSYAPRSAPTTAGRPGACKDATVPNKQSSAA